LSAGALLDPVLCAYLDPELCPERFQADLGEMKITLSLYGELLVFWTRGLPMPDVSAGNWGIIFGNLYI
jgi:hypothetical protein